MIVVAGQEPCCSLDSNFVEVVEQISHSLNVFCVVEVELILAKKQTNNLTIV